VQVQAAVGRQGKDCLGKQLAIGCHDGHVGGQGRQFYVRRLAPKIGRLQDRDPEGFCSLLDWGSFGLSASPAGPVWRSNGGHNLDILHIVEAVQDRNDGRRRSHEDYLDQASQPS
jgi:hypothetical protein